VEVLARSAQAALERITLAGPPGAASEFVRLSILDAGLAQAARETLLSLPEGVTGLRDLLAASAAPLCAALEPLELTLDAWLDPASGGKPVLRPGQIVAGLQDIARLLAMLERAGGVVWPAPDPAWLGVRLDAPCGKAPGLARLELAFYGWCGLAPGDGAAAAQALAALGRACLARCITLARDGGLGVALPALARLDEALAALEHEPHLSYARLVAALALPAPELRAHGATDAGLRREHNEDAWLILSLSQASAAGSRFTLAAVADGMGGHASGEVASSLALDLLRQHLAQCLLPPRSTQVEPGQLPQALALIIPAIDRALVERAQLDPQLAGMGTTLCGLAALESQSTLRREGEAGAASVLFWVGDSRAYLLGPGGVQRLSVDHSYVEELVQAGEIGEAEAFEHPMKNIITRCLGGSGDAAQPEIEPFALGPGELLLLCSDGLSDALRDSEIAAVVRGAAAGSLDELARALIAAANAAGGPDNITVVLVQAL
jgi:protein phosphatase